MGRGSVAKVLADFVKRFSPEQSATTFAPDPRVYPRLKVGTLSKETTTRRTPRANRESCLRVPIMSKRYLELVTVG